MQTLSTTRRHDLLERAEKIKRVVCDGANGILGFSKYTGVHAPLGPAAAYGPSFAAKQMEFTLGMLKHPLVENIIDGRNPKPADFNAEPLVKAKVLSGMKILDLGCGYVPAFARCARALGADVFTVDRTAAKQFRFYTDCFSEEMQRIEVQNHIQLNSHEPNAVTAILKKTGGQFDLVTEARYANDECFGGVKMAVPLLKEGGIYFLAGEDVFILKPVA